MRDVLEFIVRDCPREKGISIDLMGYDFSIPIFLEDKTAKELIKIIQNKLNGREL